MEIEVQRNGFLRIVKMVVLCCVCLVLPGCSFDQTLNSVIEDLEESQEKEDYEEWIETCDRIVRCLEETYSGIQFSYEETSRDGETVVIFQDENGVEFGIGSILKNTADHFGASDYYLYELLMGQDYLNKVKSIAEKYGLFYDYDEDNTTISLGKVHRGPAMEEELQAISQAIMELLDEIEVPEINYNKEATFSTGEVNEYIHPELYYIFIDLYDGADEEHVWSQVYTVSVDQKDLTQKEIAAGLREAMDELHEFALEEAKE